MGACTLICDYNHYSEVLAGIVARLVEMIPHRMIFHAARHLLTDSRILRRVLGGWLDFLCT